MGRFCWQEGSGAFSYGHWQLKGIIDYIRDEERPPSRSKPGFDATRAHEAPAAQRLEKGEQANGNKDAARPPGEPQANEPRHNTGHPEDDPRHLALAVEVASKEFRHTRI